MCWSWREWLTVRKFWSSSSLSSSSSSVIWKISLIKLVFPPSMMSALHRHKINLLVRSRDSWTMYVFFFSPLNFKLDSRQRQRRQRRRRRRKREREREREKENPRSIQTFMSDRKTNNCHWQEREGKNDMNQSSPLSWKTGMIFYEEKEEEQTHTHAKTIDLLAWLN